MTKTIKVQINCGEKTCDDCYFLDIVDNHPWCHAFGMDLDKTTKSFRRCMPCFAGEVEE